MSGELTESERHEDIDRQASNLEAGVSNSIFCPWCFKINKLDAAPCCHFFTDALKKRGEAKLQSVITQLHAVKTGRMRSLRCPYCSKWNPRMEFDAHPSEWIRPMVSPFCCNMLADAATAIVERETLRRLVEDKNKIEDAVSKGLVN